MPSMIRWIWAARSSPAPGTICVGQALEAHVQLELVVGGGAAGGVLRVVVLAADVGEGAAAEAGAGDVALDGVDDREQRGARVALEADELGVDERQHGGGLAGEVGPDEVVLALEEPVDRHLAQAGLADQLVHADAARAPAGEEPFGGVEDDGLPLGAAAANRAPASAAARRRRRRGSGRRSRSDGAPHP